MSDRSNQPRTPLWLVRRVDGSHRHLFPGSPQEMAAHISALHLASGVQYMARELDQ